MIRACTRVLRRVHSRCFASHSTHQHQWTGGRESPQPIVARLLLVSTAGSLLVGSMMNVNAHSSVEPTMDEDATATKSSDRLLNWEQNMETGRLAKKHPSDIEPERKVVLLVGITGSGKSSTANTLCGKGNKSFKLSDSVISQTSAVSYRDYNFMDHKWRVIDTPGLGDTNKDDDTTLAEIERIADFAKHGVTAIVVVVPKGRLTDEQTRTVKQIIAMFGDDVYEHTVIALTKCKQRKDAVVDDINRLPMDNLLRQLMEKVEYRLIPVDNIIADKKYIARLLLHQAFVQLDKDNNQENYNIGAYVKRMVERFSAVDTSQLRTIMKLQDGECRQTWQTKGSKVRVTIQCEFDAPKVRGE